MINQTKLRSSKLNSTSMVEFRDFSWPVFRGSAPSGSHAACTRPHRRRSPATRRAWTPVWSRPEGASPARRWSLARPCGRRGSSTLRLFPACGGSGSESGTAGGEKKCHVAPRCQSNKTVNLVKTDGYKRPLKKWDVEPLIRAAGRRKSGTVD